MDYGRIATQVVSVLIRGQLDVFHREDSLLLGLSFGELIDTVFSNEETIDERAVRKTFSEIVATQMRDAESELTRNMSSIIGEASA